MSGESIHTRKGIPLVIGEDTFIPVTDYDLSEADIERASLQLKETEAKRNECLQEIKRRLECDSHMKYLLDDQYLLRYLRVRKFDCDEAYKAIKKFYALKIKYPEAFRILPDIERLLDSHAFYYLPYVDEEGRILVVSNYENWNPDEAPFMESLSTMLTIVDIISMNPKCQINGIVSIWDTKGLTLRKVSEVVRPNRLMLFFQLAYCVAIRVKLVVVVNCDAISRMAYNIVRPFLKRKIRNRVVLLGSDLSQLHDYVNPHLLPKTLGGTLEENECRINQHILDNLPFIRYERSFTHQPDDKAF